MKRNPIIPFTYRYSQPEEYHFSIDSIEAPWEIAQHLKNHNLKIAKALDLCAGCGVMGFELNYHLPRIDHIDFVEVQNVYKKHFEENKNQVRNSGTFNFLNLNYEELLSEEYHEQYDLIICNPPYFQVGQGKLSPSEFKNRCRFYIDSTFAKLVEVIQHCLKSTGEAFVLIRSLDDHGIKMFSELEKNISTKMKSQFLADIRGTHLMKFSKQ